MVVKFSKKGRSEYPPSIFWGKYDMLHVVCAKLLLSFTIRMFSFWYFSVAVRPHSYLTKRSFYFLCIAKAFLNPRHCRGFSLTIKGERTVAAVPPLCNPSSSAFPREPFRWVPLRLTGGKASRRPPPIPPQPIGGAKPLENPHKRKLSALRLMYGV